MRIIAGAYRGHTLVAPKVHSTRPTADRTRQAIFNVLAHAAWAPDFEGAKVVDLFAGSGAFGIESLSRGAAWCLFVDSGAEAVRAVARNLEALGCAGQARVERRDAARGAAPAPAEAPFDLAFLDPPYGAGLTEPALAALRHGWLAPGAVVVVERGQGEGRLAAPSFEPLDERGWGAAKVTFLRPAAE
jgi:16S rRNA (guanine966-N2)-methyltransferase